MSFKEKLKKITSFVFDVDGVLTDGSLILYQNQMIRTMNTKDGFVMQLALKKKYNIGIISGGKDESVIHRLKYLGITNIYSNSRNKVVDFKDYLEKNNLTAEEILYMGDDLPDYEVMKMSGVGSAPKDACIDILTCADYISPYEGGKGCVRDVIEQVLRVRGDWNLKDAHFIPSL